MSTVAHPTSESHPMNHNHHDHTGAKIGMWLFLFTELLMFGILFLVYADYRIQYAGDFHFSASQLDSILGGANTLILLTSSLTMALAIAALERNRRTICVRLLSVTLALGFFFLINKYFEWSAKISHDIFPGSETLSQFTEGERQFFNLYYAMTGMHGIHVLAGMVAIGIMLYFIARKPRKSFNFLSEHSRKVSITDSSDLPVAEIIADPELVEVQVTMVYQEHEGEITGQLIRLENTGLFWHLVDLIWIFLFPLFYLIS